MRALLSCCGVLALALVWGAGPVVAAPLARSPAVTIEAPAAPVAGSFDLLAFLLTTPLVFGITIRKSTAELAQKLVTRASQAIGDYKDSVAQAGNDWEANTKASEGNYELGVQEAITKKRFGRGVAAAGSAKYTKNAVELGGARYAPGIANAKEAWARGVQPALDVLKGLQLGPKGPKRSQQNRDRSAQVQIALGALKDSR